MKKICIIGKGSIGVRHAKIFYKYGCEIFFYRTFKNLKSYKLDFFFTEINTLNDFKKNSFDLIIICNPTSLHFKTLNKLSEFTKNFFIEKPLVSNLKEVKALEKLVIKKKLNLFTGYFLRYNKNILKLKSIISNNIRKISNSNLLWYTYMPNWHPGENYKRSYTTRKKLGGGVIQTCSHEIDLASYFFGPVKDVFCKKLKSNLNLEVESSVIIILNHENGIISQINLNYISKNIDRFIEVYFDKFQLKLDLNKKYIQKKISEKKEKIIIKNYQKLVDSYENQNKYILQNLNRDNSKLHLKDIIHTEKIIQYCKLSLKNNKVTKVI